MASSYEWMCDSVTGEPQAVTATSPSSATVAANANSNQSPPSMH